MTIFEALMALIWDFQQGHVAWYVCISYIGVYMPLKGFIVSPLKIMKVIKIMKNWVWRFSSFVEVGLTVFGF